MYFDWTYVILVLPAMLFSMWASRKVNSTFEKYSRVYNSRRVTGYMAARTVLNSANLEDVKIEMVQGTLTDHYDPTDKVVRLSEAVYNSTSTAAVGVACHECGHVIQHSENYWPVKLRSAIIPVTSFGSKLSVPLVVLGLVLASFSSRLIVVAYAGIICFAAVTFFQLITLPVELDASSRALTAIQDNGLLEDDEMQGAREMLNAAALTYVAALAVSLMQLIRFISLVNRRRN